MSMLCVQRGMHNPYNNILQHTRTNHIIQYLSSHETVCLEGTSHKDRLQVRLQLISSPHPSGGLVTIVNVPLQFRKGVFLGFAVV
ncbi:hypothetical protein EON63_15275 [archaeon]|nr:MAG: hypothetical protein EON63_15275 [archaeon]